MSLGLDLIILIPLIIFGIKGYIDGFLKTVLRFAGFLAAAVIAVMLSRYLGPLVAGLFRENFINAAVEKIGEGPVTDASTTVSQILGTLPDFISGWVSQLGSPQDLASQLQASSEQTTLQIATVMVDELVIPMLGTVLQVIFYLIIFSVLMFIVRMIVHTAKAVNHVPVVGGLNRAGGALLGILEGAILALVAILIFGLVLSATGEGQAFLEETILIKSIWNWFSLKLPVW